MRYILSPSCSPPVSILSIHPPHNLPLHLLPFKPQLTSPLPAVVYKKIPVQKPGADEVLVNIKFSGVCHTDLHAVNGDWPLATKLPLVGGHEGAGIVVAVGELVKDVKIGDHAGVKVCVIITYLI